MSKELKEELDEAERELEQERSKRDKVVQAYEAKEKTVKELRAKYKEATKVDWLALLYFSHLAREGFKYVTVTTQPAKMLTTDEMLLENLITEQMPVLKRDAELEKYGFTVLFKTPKGYVLYSGQTEIKDSVIKDGFKAVKKWLEAPERLFVKELKQSDVGKKFKVIEGADRRDSQRVWSEVTVESIKRFNDANAMRASGYYLGFHEDTLLERVE